MWITGRGTSTSVGADHLDFFLFKYFNIKINYGRIERVYLETSNGQAEEYVVV